MEFPFATQKWSAVEQLSERQDGTSGFALGLHAPGFFYKVPRAIQSCWRDPQLGLSPYGVHSHVGFLKHLMLRTGRDVKTGLPELMVNLVTSSYKSELLKSRVEKILPIPEVVSVMDNANTSVGNSSVGEQEYILHGKSTITETLRGLTFEISANSFFLTNTQQLRGHGTVNPTTLLCSGRGSLSTNRNCSGLKGDGSEIILDLFCGTGTLDLALARRARHVYGYGVVPQAISDARHNARLNEISNATFVQGELNKIDDNLGSNIPKPDLVISDFCNRWFKVN